MKDIRAFSLLPEPDGSLALLDDRGAKFSCEKPVRLFPLTDPDRWISICDAEANELVCIAELGGLSLETCQMLEEELRASSFLPIIEKIINISARVDPSE